MFFLRSASRRNRQSAFATLDRIKDDPEIDELIISVLVNCERKDDPIYQIAGGHWDGANPCETLKFPQ